MGFYTALSLKCLDAVVYFPVIGVYSENEVTVRGIGTMFSTVICPSFRGSMVELG